MDDTLFEIENMCHALGFDPSKIRKEQNEALISGLDLANETISNLYGLLREYRQQKEKLLKQNTKLLAIYTVIIIAHIITAIINQSYRNSLMFYFLSVVSIVYGIDLCSQKFKKR